MTISSLFLFAGSIAVAFWGAMHIAKTRPVVAGFEPLTADNRYVLEMEWIVEGVALVFTAILVASATLFLDRYAPGAKLIYGMSVGFLLTMAAVSLFTGARASLLPYKLCAPIFATAAVLIWMGGFVF